MCVLTVQNISLAFAHLVGTERMGNKLNDNNNNNHRAGTQQAAHESLVAPGETA
jgi:hypothetical protein